MCGLQQKMGRYVYIYTYTHTHTYIHSYIHTYKYTWQHTANLNIGTAKATLKCMSASERKLHFMEIPAYCSCSPNKPNSTAKSWSQLIASQRFRVYEGMSGETSSICLLLRLGVPVAARQTFLKYVSSHFFLPGPVQKDQ